MFAVKGIVKGDAVVVGEEMLNYQGKEAIVTILDMPLGIHKSKNRVPGVAKGKFVCPDDIDKDNDLIARLFEGLL